MVYSVFYCSLFLCLLLCPLIHMAEAQYNPVVICGEIGNYTQGSQYQSNLNVVLNSLVSNVNGQNSFSYTTSGLEPNDVSGLLQCRGDVSMDACTKCGSTSVSKLLKECPYKKGATLFNDYCWLRYTDIPFYSKTSNSERQVLYDSRTASDPESFNQQVQTLMSDLTSRATSDKSNFAAGSFQGINGLVQCTRDLSEDSCLTCLQENVDALVKRCYSKLGARVMSTSCFVRYEMYQFFNVAKTRLCTRNCLPDSPSPHNGPVADRTRAAHSPGPSASDSPLPLETPDVIKFAPTEPPQPISAFHPKYPIANSLVHTAAAIVGTITAVPIIIGCWCLLTKRNRRRKLMNLGNVEAFLKECGPFGPVRYKFSDVKKLTNSFKEKIGQGGFGEVFKGKLPDGKMVAVKVLSEVKGDGNEFINEVASISRTSHVNIVSLLGFCFEGLKRALIYEFMPNGSLEKFIYGEDPLKTRPHLGWQTLYEIAIGIAQGLEYLHRGCNSRIVHFDIKPHNILLDQDFHPKIADFGLSKLCHVKESTVFVTKARGTPGYIAPEVISRNIGQVSHKSDVYSYGMMVLEMVGGRRNIDAQVSDLSEIYYPHWINKRLHLNEDLELREIGSLEDEENTRKMIIVSLWCIQIDPEIRPSMSRVLEMLEGTVEALELPPRPFSSSPLADVASPSTKA